VTTEEVGTAVNKLKAGKAAGPGNIPAELQKNALQKLYKIITQLFTICINEHIIPKEWKIAHITTSDILTGCTEFRYLGYIFTKDGRDTKNIRHRVTQPRKIIGALNGLWWSKDVTKNRKRMIYNSMGKSVLI